MSAVARRKNEQVGPRLTQSVWINLDLNIKIRVILILGLLFFCKLVQGVRDKLTDLQPSSGFFVRLGARVQCYKI